MQHINERRNLGVALAALALMAASITGTAFYEASYKASSPGADLTPLNGADELVEILQTNQRVLWTALNGSVSSFVVKGWPIEIGDAELGGGLVMERPENGSVGVIDFGEKPMSVRFELAD